MVTLPADSKPLPCAPVPADLKIGGLTPLTTIDFPGQLAAIVFCQGCPWRCRYCHNGPLLDRERPPAMGWDDVSAFLVRRRGLLDAVVFSGGEPTAQSALGPAVRAARGLGFRTGLHTNGAYPARLEPLLPALDWVGLDIKALPEDYPSLTGVTDSGYRAWESLERVKSSGTPLTVRITVHDRLLPPGKLRRLLDRLKTAGIQTPVVQPCRSEPMLDPSLGPSRYRPADSA